MEQFAIPAVGGIIEKKINGIDHILIQEREKVDASQESGLFEIPAGKIREFENIFDALRREIWEETGLEITYIEGEDKAIIYEAENYKVINYTPFSSSQNLLGYYPIMVQIFICHAKGDLLERSNESKNLQWISLRNLQSLLEHDVKSFYPMHVESLKKYIKEKL